MDLLPSEIFNEIVFHLLASDIHSMLEVNKYFYKILNKKFWKQFVKNKYDINLLVDENFWKEYNGSKYEEYIFNNKISEKHKWTHLLNRSAFTFNINPDWNVLSIWLQSSKIVNLIFYKQKYTRKSLPLFFENDNQNSSRLGCLSDNYQIKMKILISSYEKINKYRMISGTYFVMERGGYGNPNIQNFYPTYPDDFKFDHKRYPSEEFRNGFNLPEITEETRICDIIIKGYGILDYITDIAI